MTTTPTLPRDDTDPEGRRRGLAEAREAYVFGYDFYGLPLATEVPKAEGFSASYLVKLLRVGVERLENHAAVDWVTIAEDEVPNRVLAFTRMFGEAVHGGLPAVLRQLDAELHAEPTAPSPPTLDDYMKLYETVAPPQFQASNVEDDRVFAWQRVAGANPLVLAACGELPSHFPVSEEIFARATGGASLEGALRDGRLFLADYALLDGIETNDYRGRTKYLYAPLALFWNAPATEARPGGLVPVAVQCGQTPGPDTPIFTPQDGWRWRMAKATVQTAEGTHHEMVGHLGETHMVVERFVIAAARQLSSRHPVMVLLKPHFAFTLEINDIARKQLLAKGGPIDLVIAGGADGCAAVTGRALAAYRFDEAGLEARLRARGVADAAVLADYPYRDDARPLHDAISTFVRGYLALYYHHDADVAGDLEVQAWVDELTAASGGQLQGLAPIRTRERLHEVLTQLVFTCSVQHAAVNFPQYPCFGYAPNVPGAGYTPAPRFDTPDEERSLLEMLPGLDAAFVQMNTVYGLSGVHHTELGGYDDDHFADPRVGPLVLALQARLAEISEATAARNRGRFMDYSYLLPENVPQSINI